MKVMCIHSVLMHEGYSITAGKVYTVVSQVRCERCNLLYYALAEKPPLPHSVDRPWCGRCRGPMPHTDLKHYRYYHFAPWNPEQLNISVEDANKLYDTTPDKEKVT